MKRGKLIVLEAGDASGKATQAERLLQHLAEDGFLARKIEFPNYQSDSSALIQMYLRGDFGGKADQVNPYVASTFYTVDRFASYRMEWEEFYTSGGIVIADRYTTSNMLHQAVKMSDRLLREQYLRWLEHFEFDLFGLPRPDCVLFLDLPPQYSARLLAQRRWQANEKSVPDIHEQDLAYLARCYASAQEVIAQYGWRRIPCIRDEQLRSIEEIHADIYQVVKAVLA
ncbi:MAG: thymidylate kinase [Peptococcaceae bacterium]|jgi:dTMP kinase|nr:thymidylate kinase [Peptococcaceae bacterium]